MQPIILLAGPPAAGKSSTSRALAARFDRMIHIPVDDLRHMVLSGLVLPSVEEWGEGLLEQIRLARESAINMALKYQAAGFAVVLDDFLDIHHLKEYGVLEDNPGFLKFALFPEKEAVLARCRQRDGEGSLIEGAVHYVYGMLETLLGPLRDDSRWTILDTTEMSVAEVVDAIIMGTESSKE